MDKHPIIKDVVLIGGGHSHVLLIRQWAMQSMAGVRLTLVSDSVKTPYSGMLPGLIAGHYSHNDVHIDLARLCEWANVRFIEARLTAINLSDKTVSVTGTRPLIEFDVLLLDTGSTPDLAVPGAADFSVPVKPVYGFFQRWQQLQSRLTQLTENNNSEHTGSCLSVGVVGSGAGGFELVTAMRHALPVGTVECHWFVRGDRVIKSRPPKVSELALAAARALGVNVHLNFDVVDVLESAVVAADGRRVDLDETLWCTAAKAPSWPKQAGLSVDARGFVSTNRHLQSRSHPFVFATGDIGTQEKTPSDKAGVFAVRQAPVLFQNVRRYLLSKPLKTYKPQNDFLSLMATGKRSAIGNRGFLTVQGGWVWRWKNAIDRKFMNKFVQLPERRMHRNAVGIPKALLAQSQLHADHISNSDMRCKGCGSKVGAPILDTVLASLQPVRSRGVVSAVAEADDAAVISIEPAALSSDIQFNQLVQSVDQINAFCSDPYVFARIATVHALSDIYVSGAQAHSAQVIVNLPFADSRIVKRELKQLMAGVVDVLNEEQCQLIGGHTAEANELSLGFVVNGLSREPAQVTTETNRPKLGDQLILSKPLGTGVLFAGQMRALANGADVQQALHFMQKSNRQACEIFLKHNITQLTDVTGFGLLGHLRKLLGGSGVSATIMCSSVPLYAGTKALATNGVESTLLKQNQAIVGEIAMESNELQAYRNLLCDPQTSGGVLAIVPPGKVERVLKELNSGPAETSVVIGTLSEGDHFQLLP